MKISAFAYAKVNLYLKVLEKRNDGLHNLDMIMQSVSLADKVTLKTEYGNSITVVCNGAKIDYNIAETAAKAYFSCAGMAAPNIKIEIEKNIPISGGLAGGSADAAAVLALCNRVFGYLSQDELLELAGKIGSDVPFCLIGGTARVGGFGEKIQSFESDSDYTMVLVKARTKHSTGHMYALLDKSQHHISADSDLLINYLKHNDKRACEHMQNDFTQLWNDVASLEICSMLNEHGANAVNLSGSGPTFYGVFYSKDDAQNCFNELRKKYNLVYLCSPVTSGIKIIE